MNVDQAKIKQLQLGVLALRSALFEVIGGKPGESLEELERAFRALPEGYMNETLAAALHAIAALQMTKDLVN